MILQETLSELKRLNALDGLNIKKIFLSRHYSAVLLTNGSVGTALNYAMYSKNISQVDIANQIKLEESLLDESRSDPMLLKTILEKESLDLNMMSLRLSILSALSFPYISNEDLMSRHFIYLKKPFNKIHEFLDLIKNVSSDGDVATVIGFGGIFELLNRLDTIKRIYVTDLYTESRKDKIQKKISELNMSAGFEKVIFLPASENERLIKKSDIVSISASALCNGTMEQLLDWSSGCRTVIVQGISGGILPFSLFRRNVSILCCETKSEDYLEAYLHDDEKYKAYTEKDDQIVILKKRKQLCDNLG